MPHTWILNYLELYKNSTGPKSCHQEFNGDLANKLNGKKKMYNREKIKATGIKTEALRSRKLLMIHGGFHPKSGTLRLYAKSKEGGVGLVSVRTTIQNETTNINEYIRKMAATDHMLSEYIRQQKPEKRRSTGTGTIIKRTGPCVECTTGR